jgi:hypothetical protein
LSSAAPKGYPRGTAIAHWGDFVVEVMNPRPFRVAVRSIGLDGNEDWWWVPPPQLEAQTPLAAALMAVAMGQ